MTITLTDNLGRRAHGAWTEPEPGSVVLFGMGALGLGFVAYRRRQLRAR